LCPPACTVHLSIYLSNYLACPCIVVRTCASSAVVYVITRCAIIRRMRIDYPPVCRPAGRQYLLFCRLLFGFHRESAVIWLWPAMLSCRMVRRNISTALQYLYQVLSNGRCLYSADQMSQICYTKCIKMLLLLLE